ncbi:MAG TPA: DUF4382 domain-containing protein [Chlorobiota bacterium]|nr:DUF4382 domain-containing protein [Chlorobiota bacterium]
MKLTFSALFVTLALLAAGCAGTMEPVVTPKGDVRGDLRVRVVSNCDSPQRDCDDDDDDDDEEWDDDDCGYKAEGKRRIDSVRIDRVRILVSRVKLHVSKHDTTTGGCDVKGGPLVLTFDDDSTTPVLSAPLPKGRYEKIKLEMHKFSSDEAGVYASDTVFSDFCEPRRVTIIVEGRYWADSTEKTFTLSDDETANLWINIDPYVEIAEDGGEGLLLDFNALKSFRVRGRVIDPDDDDARYVLRGRLKFSIKARGNGR